MGEMTCVPLSEMQTLATAIAKSGLFGIKTPDQALALMAISQAEGRHPALAAAEYHIIQNRPALKADAMLARFQAAGGKVEWTAYSDAKCIAKFSHPSGGTVTVDWDMDRARRAGLADRENWRNYSRAMLRSRVISEGVRTVLPGCVMGMYTPEEIQDEAPRRTAEPQPPADGESFELKEDKKELTIDDIRNAGKGAVSRAGREKVDAFMKSHNWVSALDIPKDDYEAVVAQLQSL